MIAKFLFGRTLDAVIITGNDSTGKQIGQLNEQTVFRSQRLDIDDITTGIKVQKEL
jgi:hypothetical protein